MSVRSLRAGVPIVAFGTSLAAIYAAALAIVPRLSDLERPGVIAGALTLDLTLLVPLLYYLLLVRPRGWPPLTVLPVFLLSVVIAGRLIPATQHHVLDLLGYGAVLAELTLLAVIVRRCLQLRRGYRERKAAGRDVLDSLRESARSVLGSVAGGVVAYEVAIFHYAVAGWVRSPTPDARSFSVHRESAYTPFMLAMLAAVLVETAAVHLLVRLWSPVAAWTRG